MSAARRVVLYALFTAIAMVLAYIEHLIPPLTPLVWVKLGLGNIITVYLLYERGIYAAFVVSCVRAVLSALLFAGMMSLPYSLTGVMFSVLIMFVLIRVPRHAFSVMGVSVAGAFAHNCGQLLTASAFLQGFSVFAFFPWMTLLSIPTGIFVGLCARFLLKTPLIEQFRSQTRGGYDG